MLALARPPSVTHPVQLHLAPENPVDAHRVGQHDRHANDRNREHDAQGLRGGGRVVNGQAVSDVRVAQHEIRKHLQAEQPHQRHHRHARGNEGPPVASEVDFARDVGDGEHVDQRHAEEPRVRPHARGHVRHVKQRGHRRHGVTDDEEDHAVLDPAAELGVQFAFGFHHGVDRAVHHEERHGGDAHQQRIRAQQAQERAGEFAAFVNGHAPGDVAHRNANEQARQDAAARKTHIPHLPPPAHRLLAAELDGDRAEDERHEQQHERKVKPREHGGIDVRKRGEQCPAAGHQPDLIAVPHRPDGVEHQAAVFVLLREQMQRADAQVEAVEHRVAREQHTDEDEPGGVKIEVAEVHGGKAFGVQGLKGSASFPVGVRSASSGPCWILSLSR